MRIIKLLILVLVFFLITTLFYSETIEFCPTTLYIELFFSIDIQYDGVYIVGKLRNGDIIGIAVAVKKYKSNDSTAFDIGKNDKNGIFQDYLSFDENKCKCINDILKYCNTTWYKVTVDEIRPGMKKPLTKFWSLLYKPYKFISIPPISTGKLKDKKIINTDKRYESN